VNYLRFRFLFLVGKILFRKIFQILLTIPLLPEYKFALLGIARFSIVKWPSASNKDESSLTLSRN